MTEKPVENDDFTSVNCQQFFEESLCGFIIADAQGVIENVNARITKWTGLSANELAKKRFSDLLAIGGKIYYETHLWPLLRMQGYFDEVLVEISNVSGEKEKVLVNARECRNESNKVYAIHFTITKASDRLQYEQNLQHQKNAAEKELVTQKEQVILREQLIAVLGHDLRNPLNAITVVTEMLKESQGQNLDSMLGVLTRSSYRMKELITNIMDFARTRLGEGMRIDWQRVVLVPLLQQVISELQLVYPQRKIEAIFDVIEPVYCDPSRICQLFSNLLANALTHSLPESPVKIYASHDHKNLKLMVSNAGKPIDQELREQLFNPFVKESKRASQNGLGLGLYISAEIARAHHATLTFVSDEEQTTFTLDMPVDGRE